MDAKTKKILFIAFAIIVALFLLFSGLMMAGSALNGGMMEAGAISGFNWMWIPALLMFGLCALLIWVIFGQKIDRIES